MTLRHHLTMLGALALLASCSSVPTRTFQILSMDTNKAPVPSMVIVGDDWQGAGAKNQFVNIDNERLALTVAFDRPEVLITVAAVKLDAQKKPITPLPTNRAEAAELSGGYVPDQVKLRLTDPETTLFILPKR